ncbi:kinase-like protein [Aureobasidium pullulans]|uniref:non-specific serine/threonine protein kinase n=1 Tax=Aureobasidium pullulans TaxID=5580 RepID=A0A4S9BIU8_AURPU|nr:kinase-like protein [Aureobasidium pullulans]
MARRRPPATALTLGNALFCIFVWLPLIATAQQQQSVGNNANIRRRPSLSNARSPPELRSTHKHLKDTAIDPSIERALATFAPAESIPAVRAPPARSSATSGGLSSRHPARSLQDWQVEDIILLATVDGKLHARDRRTGAPRWEIEADRPMIETVYHHNDSDPESQPETSLIWIVEPSQDGSLYVYSSEPQTGMQKLGLSVKQLVEELSPYAGEDPPVVYTADKKNTLYTVDASNGRILKTFSSSASTFSNDQNCRRVNGLGSLEDNECETIGTLTLGRTEYTVSIADKLSGDPICTIRYFEWGPNNRDKDLHNQYASTMDSKYIYTQHDGSVVAVDYRETSRFGNSILYKQKFSSPVARVYDVVRPLDEDILDASLVILPQPIGPAGDDTIEQDKIFVNCTESGSWYAMSELRYPTVTDGASKAVCYTQGYALPVGTFNPAKQRANLVGIHPLHPMSMDQSEILTIGGPDQSVIGSPNAYNTDHAQVMLPGSSNPWAGITSSGLIGLLALIGLFAIVSRWVDVQKVIQRQIPEPVKLKEAPIPVTSNLSQAIPSKDDSAPQVEAIDRKVRFPEPAEETIFPQGDEEEVPEKQSSTEEPIEVKVDSPTRASTPSPAEAEKPAEEQTPVKPKKKATRGVRGGRKAKEKRQEQLEAQQRRRENSQSNSDKESNGALATPLAKPLSKIDGMDVISVDASESPNVSGKIQINNLTIDTDKIIGHGSAGTCVFEGKFEGRDVAVKRMLSQYYELASQEVGFLQQSDHDKNVIRYFCQQKDQHFLYIAVELCQASLWDLFNLPDTRDEARYQQLQSLAQAVQRDARGTLYQLAKGLYHLHDLRIIHRDIKPQNILIAFPKPNKPNELRLVISDFGLCKTLPENVSTLIDPTSNAGTCGWKAPELISQPKDTASNNGHSNISHPGTSESSSGGAIGGVKRAADIFSLGCLFFWVLTGGDHPYDDKEGWMQMRELNIKKNNLQNMHKLDLGSDSEEPRQLITAMLAHNPEDRPSAQQVLCHPFFWSPKKRLDFLCDVSDHFEHEQRDPPSPHLNYLESYADMVIGGKDKDWQRKLDRMFLDTLGKQRKYNGAKMLDLLRALRNKKNHYEDMSMDVKKRVGPLPHGYLQYFTIKFPTLLMACFWAIKDCRVETNARFRSYYSIENQE